MKVVLDGRSLTPEQVGSVAAGGARVALAREAARAMTASRAVVRRALDEGRSVYGVNTGFGHLAGVAVAPADLRRLQYNLIRSHCTGTGPPFDAPTVRAILLLRANVLARGHTGARPEIVRRLVDMLEADILPVIPSQGSVGASGDLSPLAHAALAVIGEGPVIARGRRRTARKALADAGLEPLALEPKEGLALINGTQATTAVGVLALLRAERLVRTADLAAAVSIEALRGSVRPFDARIHRARPHRGQKTSAANLRRLLRGSEIMRSHRHCGKVQDSYALRCAPQVHGASRHAAAEARRVLAVELNASTDNPMVFARRGDVIPGGNFHGEIVGTALDYLALAVTSLGTISERRTDRLVHPMLSNLPAFLARKPGLESGLMLAQVTAAALASENKTLAHPATVDSIPTSGNQEDHVPMSTWAARKLVRILDNLEGILAIELLAGMQALDFLDPLTPATAVQAARAAFREAVPPRRGDRVLAPEIEAARRLVREGTLLDAAGSAVGPIR